MKQILETERVYLRQLTQEDYGELAELLADAEVMYAYEHAFTPEEIHCLLYTSISQMSSPSSDSLMPLLLMSRSYVPCGLVGMSCRYCWY